MNDISDRLIEIITDRLNDIGVEGIDDEGLWLPDGAEAAARDMADAIMSEMHIFPGSIKEILANSDALAQKFEEFDPPETTT